MSSERKFQELLAEVTTRANTTLTIAVLASSASLVLFGIANRTNPDFELISSAGVLFPVLGVLYRELTILSIDTADLSDLASIRGFPATELARNKLLVRAVGQFRRATLRILLIFPSALWIIEKWELGQSYPIEAIGEISVYFVTGAILEWMVKDSNWKAMVKVNREKGLAIVLTAMWGVVFVIGAVLLSDGLSIRNASTSPSLTPDEQLSAISLAWAIGAAGVGLSVAATAELIRSWHSYFLRKSIDEILGRLEEARAG